MCIGVRIIVMCLSLLKLQSIMPEILFLRHSVCLFHWFVAYHISAEVKQQSVQNGGKNAKLGRFVNFYVGNQE